MERDHSCIVPVDPLPAPSYWDEMCLESMLARFPGDTSFWEVPDKASPDGAFAAVTIKGVTWALNEDPPRPISEAELRERGAFRCKPEDAQELLPDTPS